MIFWHNKFKDKKGFTLVELLVVLGIIGVLVTLGLVAIKYARDRARVAKVQHDLNELYTAISVLANDTNMWPGNQTVNAINSVGGNEICDDDVNSNSCGSKLSDNSSGLLNTDGSYSGWGGEYMKKIPTDPWGKEYFFDTDYQIDVDDNPCGCGGGGCTDAVVLGSYGPDGEGVPTGGFPGSYGCDDIIRIIVQ